MIASLINSARRSDSTHSAAPRGPGSCRSQSRESKCRTSCRERPPTNHATARRGRCPIVRHDWMRRRPFPERQPVRPGAHAVERGVGRPLQAVAGIGEKIAHPDVKIDDVVCRILLLPEFHEPEAVAPENRFQVERRLFRRRRLTRSAAATAAAPSDPAVGAVGLTTAALAIARTEHIRLRKTSVSCDLLRRQIGAAISRQSIERGGRFWLGDPVARHREGV